MGFLVIEMMFGGLQGFAAVYHLIDHSPVGQSAQVMVVDEDKTWLGTSNWGGDYFYKSRNIGIIATGKNLNAELTQSFDHYWNSEYAIPVDPNVEYKVKNQAKKE